MEMLQVKNLKKTFYNQNNENIKAVNDVSFSINTGKSLGILGASGSGKSTILKLIFNLQKADGGNIYFKNHKLLGASKKERSKLQQNMGLVLQDPYSSLCSAFTIKEILLEPLIFSGKFNKKDYDIDILKETLLDVGLDIAYLQKYPHNLSGGERQRVAFARALMLKPEFLALDEPASMLDEKVKFQISNLIKDVKEKYNMTILIITHDISFAEDLCDDIAVMKDGKIIEYNDTENIINKPQSEYSQKLILAATWGTDCYTENRNKGV